MRFYLLLSTAVVALSSSPACASANAEVLGTHTTHLPLELKSTPSNSFKIAAICALGDERCGLDTNFDKTDNDTSSGAKKCRNNGFVLTQKCPAPKIIGERCKDNSSYSKPCLCPNSVTLNTNEICTNKCDENCIEKSTCDNGFIANTVKDKCLNNTPPSGSSFTACSSCQIQTATGITEAGNRYYFCRSKTCSDSGHNSNVPTNNKCSSINICDNTCFNNCYKPTCSEGGYTNSIPSGQTCSTISFYGQTCYENCKPYCSIGAIYYSDGTCSINVETGKTPIGIAFDETNKLVVALDVTQKYWNDGTSNWKDIPTLTNFTSSSSALMDTNGKDNTDKIIAFQSSSGQVHQAAEYCATYITAGTNKGDWFLPALWQLSRLYQSKASVNAGLSKLGRSALNENWHWSSSEYGTNGAWFMYLGNGNDHAGYKYGYNNYVRPVLAF